MINPVFSLNAAVLQKAASAQKLRGDTPLSLAHTIPISFISPKQNKHAASPSNTHTHTMHAADRAPK
jgi:hypothetical protein